VVRALVSLLTLAAAIYLLIALAIYLLQEKMIFLSGMPGRQLTASPADIGLDYQDVSLATTDGERLHGWFVPAASRRGTALFFHGNAGNISHRLDSIEIFHRLGLDTLIVDYRGYGESTGRTTEAGTYRDAEAAWRYLADERGIPADQILVFGRSLGGAIGAWMGSRQRPAAVIIESSFTSGADMARHLYPFLPARTITRLRYPVTEYAAQLNCPVLVVHSRDDEIIPFEMGRAIYAAVPGDKSFLSLRGGHNDTIFVSRSDYVSGLGAFVESVFGPAGHDDGR
jgi:fermentation-respiration switch protein FrsA (DUF1100 family)